MHYYIYTRPGHPDNGMGYCSPEPIAWGNGAKGDARYYVPCDPPAPPIVTLDDIRKKRNGLLNRTDWTQLPDSPLSDTLRKKYQVYRQALRDMTNADSVDAMVFPEPPFSDA